MSETVEPWLRKTRQEVDAVRRQVLHALDLTMEDVARWCVALTDAEVNERPYGVAPVAYHLRHIARSLDRLLTYAEGRQLSDDQRKALESEMAPGAVGTEVLQELRQALKESERRILEISPKSYEEPRGVGREGLPSTVGGLLVHCAEHTQRHSGQAITTAKVVSGMRGMR